MPRKKPAPEYISNGGVLEVLTKRNWWSIVSHVVNGLEAQDNTRVLSQETDSDESTDAYLPGNLATYSVKCNGVRFHKLASPNKVRVRSGYKDNAEFIVLDEAEGFPRYIIAGEMLQTYAWAMQCVMAASLMNLGNTYGTVEVVGGLGLTGSLVVDVLSSGSSEIRIIDRHNQHNKYSADLVFFMQDSDEPIVPDWGAFRHGKKTRVIVGGGRTLAQIDDVDFAVSGYRGRYHPDQKRWPQARLPAGSFNRMMEDEGLCKRVKVFYPATFNTIEPHVLEWFVKRYEGYI